MTPEPQQPISWRDRMDWIDKPGGHIVISLFLLAVIAPLFYFAKIPKSEDIVVFALGVMARSMSGVAVARSASPSAEKA